jgi:lysophospholipase L1-like esterase
MHRWLALALIVWPLPARADVSIEDPSGAMRAFYQALSRVSAKQPGALVRVLHYGDSITSNDAVTHAAREALQSKYGDGGAGFVPFALPSPSFRHFTAQRTFRGWTVKNVTFKKAGDGRYGVGGSAFEGGAGAESTFSTVKKGTLGSKVARFDIYYMVQPGGGSLALELDGKPAGTLSTAGEIGSGFHSVEAPDGAHSLTVRVVSGRVRVFGVVMERPGPGVTYDNLGLASNSAKSLKTMRADYLAQQHAHRAADLIIVHLGANEADWYAAGPKSIAEYAAVYDELIGNLRAAAPKASCLIMGSTDAAIAGTTRVVPKPAIPGMVEAQRKVAAAKGCAFWDALTWMGGQGSVVKWRKQGDWEPDLTHPNASGAARLAGGLVGALVAGFTAWQKR